MAIAVAELKHAEINVAKYVQREAFPELAEKVKKTSCICRLEPIRLDDDLLHVGGRLHSHPMILPKCHDVVDRIISHFPKVSGQSVKEHVLAHVRTKFWIVDAKKPAVRRVLRKCSDCRRRNLKPICQRMADLPAD